MRDFFIDNKARYINFSIEEMPSFCACLVVHNFRISSWVDDDSKEEAKAWMQLSNLGKITQFTAGLLYSEFSSMYFLSDRKGGIADKHIFSIVPEIPFTVCRKKWVADLSPYFTNPNTRNKVRTLILRRKT